jgi:hypothetical protein
MEKIANKKKHAFSIKVITAIEKCLDIDLIEK